MLDWLPHCRGKSIDLGYKLWPRTANSYTWLFSLVVKKKKKKKKNVGKRYISVKVLILALQGNQF